jgi:hypothetical protein
MLHQNNNFGQRPGLASGPMVPMLSEVASFGQVGIQWKGYSVNAIAGTQTYTISQPGNMRTLAGATLFGTAGLPSTQLVSLNVNSNLVIDNIPALAICPQGPTGHVNNAMAFFPLYRPLEGNDNIQFTVIGTANVTLYLVLYYLPA